MTAETGTYRLEWMQSVRMWVVRWGEQPVAWFDGEDKELAEEFVANMSAIEQDELLRAKSQAF